MHRTRCKIAGLYFILLAGGLWHVLGWFQELMRITAGPLLIALNLWIFIEGLSVLTSAARRSLTFWFAGVAVSGFLLEWLGSRSGLIFGNYAYSDILQPQISGVPLAIGFAWPGIALASIAMLKSLWPKIRVHFSLLAVLGAVLMVFFDGLMEPAAIQLNYWSWQGGHVPVQNYIAWGVFGFIFLLLAPRGIERLTAPPLWRHAYIAQAIYFILVLLAGVNA